jgi:hypothetical protein
MKANWSICAAVLIAATAAAWASYLDEEEGPAPASPRVLRPVPRVMPPPRPPQPDNPLTRAIRDLSVLPGHTYKGLTVFPLAASRAFDSTDYLSAGEALERGALTISEKEGGEVSMLVVENTGKRPILLLAGEILLGGKQNRILEHDLLLPARSGPVRVPVYCVEHGRWSGRTVAFEAAPSVAALGVRAAGQGGRGQQDVWDSVSEYEVSLRVSTSTGDLGAVQDSPEVRRAVSDYAKEHRRRWPRETVGMVVARWGRVVGADVFCNEEVFLKHRDRLIKSYAVDCVAGGLRRPEGIEVEADRSLGERFLRQALYADYAWEGTPGDGRLLTLRAPELTGEALVLDEEVVHAALLAQPGPVIQPVPMPRPPRPMPEEPPPPLRRRQGR